VVETLPPEGMSQYFEVAFCFDIIFVNKLPMFVSISCIVMFSTIQDTRNRSSKILMLGIQMIVKVYHEAGFIIVDPLMDGESKPLQGELVEMGICLNTAAPDEHVGDI
jgi:hypothetical protein